jgi:hypothetical protein
MKAQGLPINFIVLAALAILILILATGFILGGGLSISASISPDQARASCQNACLNVRSAASTMDTYVSGATVSAGSSYCKNYVVAGVSAAGGPSGGLTCADVRIGTSCVASFADGTSCNIKCSGQNAVCA